LANRAVCEPKIQKARTCDLNPFAPLAYIQAGQNVSGELSRVRLPRFSQRHQGIGLVVAKFCVGAGADLNRREVSVRDSGCDHLPQALFD
jgi:hypothetical protein